MSKSSPIVSSSSGIIVLAIPAFLVPLVFLDTTIDPLLAPRFTLLAVALLFAVVYLYNDIRAFLTNGILRRAITVPLAAYLFCMTLSLTQAINLPEAVFDLLKSMLFMVSLLVATVSLRTHQRTITALTKGISILVIMVTVIGISQYYQLGFDWIPGSATARPYSTFANKNLFSSFLFLTIPFIVYGYYTFSYGWANVAALSIALLTYAILVAQTRGVWVAIGASFCVWAAIGAFFFVKKKYRVEREETRVYAARTRRLIVLIVAVVALNLFLPQLIHVTATSHITTTQKASSILNAEDSSRNERIMLWKKSLLMVGEHPVLGVGAGNWKINLPKYGVLGTRMEKGTVHFPQPHNDLLWVAAECGVAGGIAYIAMFLVCLYYCLKIIKTPEDIHDRLFATALAFGITGYLAISFFDFPKERIEHLVYVGLLLAGVVATYDRLFPSRERPPSKLVPVFVGLILAVLTSAVMLGGIRVNAEVQARKALAAKERLDWDGVIREIDAANPGLVPLDPMVTPLTWYRGVARFSKNDVDGALMDFEKAYEIHPYHIHVLNNLATCYEMKGDHGRAIEFYSKVLAISPHFEESLLNLTAVYFNAGRYEDAYTTIQQCGNSHDPRAPQFLAAVKGKLNIP